MECGCCVKLVASLQPSFDSHAMTTSDPLPSSKILTPTLKRAGNSFHSCRPLTCTRKHTNTHAYTNLDTYSCSLFIVFLFPVSLISTFPFCLFCGIYINIHTLAPATAPAWISQPPSSPHNKEDLFTSYVNMLQMFQFLSRCLYFTPRFSFITHSAFFALRNHTCDFASCTSCISPLTANMLYNVTGRCTK